MNGYFINSFGQCELINCEENPEVTTGCIICSDKINEYKPQKKCQSCKKGFFKTKNESCVFCKAIKNGGPNCEICEYSKDENGNETNEIRCKYCSEWNTLSSDGKCYNCQEEVGYGCSICNITINENDGSKNIICSKCGENYILTKNGLCIYYMDYFQIISEKIPHCEYQNYDYVKYKLNKTQINEVNEESNESGNLNTAANEEIYDYKVIQYCKTCKNGYYLTNNGTCEHYTPENCSLLSIISNQNSIDRYHDCSKIFQNNKIYTLIEYYYEAIDENQNESNNLP